jgi:uncharacterized protein
MDTGNVDVVRGIYLSFFRDDIPAILDVLSEDVDWVWHGPALIPWAGRHEGRDGVAGFFAAVAANAEVERYEPAEFIAGEGGVVTVLGWQRVRAVPTGRTWETDWAHVWTLREGKVVRVREFYDTAAIAAALAA